MKNYFLLPITLVSLCLAGCATVYQPAGAGGGYSETELAPGQFRVHFDGNENTPIAQSRDFALLRAAELCLQHGYKYFLTSDQTPAVPNFTPPIPPGPNVQVNNYGNTYNNNNNSGMMQWHDDTAAASANASAGLSRLANFLAAQKQQRQLAQTELLVRCFEVKPPGIAVLDATLITTSLRKAHGITTATPKMPQKSDSQNNPMSGSYLGSGTTVINGVEQAYQIALEVFDSGRIAFVCTAFANNQPAVVAGKGTVDSAGNVTVQNESGDTGQGTISGDVLKAGGESSGGSIKSSFTALKQK